MVGRSLGFVVPRYTDSFEKTLLFHAPIIPKKALERAKQQRGLLYSTLNEG